MSSLSNFAAKISYFEHGGVEFIEFFPNSCFFHSKPTNEILNFLDFFGSSFILSVSILELSL